MAKRGYGIGDKVRLGSNYKKYGFPYPWGWVKGFILDKENLGLGGYGIDGKGKFAFAGAKVTHYIIAVPDLNDPHKNWYYLKTKQVSVVDVV
ncbi:hypothetical protein SAMN05660649_05038 [Desulfotomaculum arcticum]|uniref:Uncharacterized protein n=1 Tax=Desulfotruncus arcticus DSM 17038 TaxID=1121424 RepID=A0A1I2ZNS7_9FIRM|nr:hypothetical protein [Desulfotruncus arcticus]SFH39350.1 hypothetical protein SAMN05660649_05038 [Desulfotomaculum arcticum] [Desulfotruncus arcticus DSM 17038]